MAGKNAMKSKLLTTGITAFVVGALASTSIGAQQRKDDPLRDMDEFIAVYKKVRANYVDKVDDEQLMKGAIQGMLNTLDPHSAFLDESNFRDLQTQIEGEYGGLGLSVTQEDGAIKVIAPTADTPADKAGIKAGDYITHLDGELIVGGTVDDAVNRMRGTPGTSIKLTIFPPRPRRAVRPYHHPRDHRSETGEVGGEGQDRRDHHNRLFRRNRRGCGRRDQGH
jgi:carboxyl-terminal processing protease